MRLNQLTLDQIIYNYTDYEEGLYLSVKRIGFSFPIKIKQIDDQYYCVDGHKRLTVITDILKEDPLYKRGNKVTVIIENSTNVRSNDCWRGRNTH